MKNLVRLVASAALSLMLVSGVGLTLTGCSAESLSGPGLEAHTNETGGGTGSGGSEHNTHDKTGGETGGGTSGGGSEHNTDDSPD